MINLKNLYDISDTMEQPMHSKAIMRFVVGLFVELSNEFKIQEHDLGYTIFHDMMEWDDEEIYQSTSLDHAIEFGEMDITFGIEWTSSCDRFFEYDVDGRYAYVENKEHDITRIVFNIFGNVFDITEFKDVREIVFKCLQYNEE